jgi:hypothetical protein
MGPPFSFRSAKGDKNTIRYEYSVGSTAGASDISQWQSMGKLTSLSTVGPLTLSPETTYFYNVRAVNSLENTSNVLSSSGWTVKNP